MVSYHSFRAYSYYNLTDELVYRGPLIFCLLLSLLLSLTASPAQKTIVFSGIFTLVWVGEAVVTMQIKLLGGTMCVTDIRLH